MQSIATSTSQEGWITIKESVNIPAATLFTNHKSSFGLGVDDQMVLTRTKIDQLDFTHNRYQQYYKGIKVIGKEYTEHSKGGRVKLANGHLLRGINIDVTPSVSVSNAFHTALNTIGATEYMWQDSISEQFLKQIRNDPAATYLPTPELVVISDSNTPRLVYQINVASKTPSANQGVYVDANTGMVLAKFDLNYNATGKACTNYNGKKDIETTPQGTSSLLKDNTRGGGIVTQNLNGAVVTAITNPTNDWPDAACSTNSFEASAHWAAEMTYDYFFKKHGRNSYDNLGGKMTTLFSDNSSLTNNATFEVNSLTVQIGPGLTNATKLVSLDLLGHEWTHALAYNEGALTGLAKQSLEIPSLNESFADIFGTMVEFYAAPHNANWIMFDNSFPSTGGVRSMSNPKLFGHPDTYQGENWVTNVFSDVHVDAGVQNFWFYLLSEGGTGTNDINTIYSTSYTYHVTGIGKENAAKIAYRNLTIYMQAGSTYIDARRGAIQSAIDIFGCGSNEVTQTIEAWNAVGVYDAIDAAGGLIPPVADAGTNLICSGQIGPCIKDLSLTYSWLPTEGLSDPNIANPIANPSTTTVYTLTVTRKINNVQASNTASVTVEVPYNQTNFTVTNSATWLPNSNPFGNQQIVSIEKTLTIPAGVHLTVIGMTFKMGKNAKIIVAPKAQLTATQTTFTAYNGCGLNNIMWQGFEVLGNSSAGQSITTNTQQGILRLNNSTIENALLGVSLGSVTANAAGNLVPNQPNNHGGIVIAKSSIFKNNKRSVAFWAYAFPNFLSSSLLQSNTFIVNQNLKNGSTTTDFVHLEEIAGVRIKGNSFKDANANAPIPFQTVGISSTDANYHVTPFCACPIILFNPHGGASGGIKADCSGCNSLPNRFEGLQTGIYADNSNPLLSLEIIGNEFKNNFISIRLSGVDGAIVSRNQINITQNLNLAFGKALGLVLQGSDMYKVQNNTFTSQNYPLFGILVDQSEVNDNLIRKNDFNSTAQGIHAQKNNGGLFLECNTFSNTFKADIAITSGPFDPTQGVCKKAAELINTADFPANNQFSNDPFVLDFWMNTGVNTSLPIGGDHLTYEYSRDLTGTYNLAPVNFNTNTNPTMCVPTNATNPIPDFDPNLHCAVKEFTPTRKFIRGELNVLSVKRTQLKQRIDGGKTKSLLQLVQSAAPHNTIKKALESASPLLSDKVLLAVLQRTPAFNHSMVLKILGKNSPLTPLVWTAVKGRIPALPKKEVKKLEKKQKGISPRQQLDAKIARTQKAMQLNKAELIRQFMHDTLTPMNRIDSIIMVFRTPHWRPDGTALQTQEKVKLIQALLIKKAFAPAEQKIAALEAKLGVANKTCRLLRVSTALRKAARKNRALRPLPKKTKNKALDTLAAMQLTVREIAQSTHSKTAINAQALLQQVFGESVPIIIEPIILNDDDDADDGEDDDDGDNEGRSPIFLGVNAQNKTAINAITLYPNPASNSVTLEYRFTQKDNPNTVFILQDIMGRTVLQKALSNTNGKVQINLKDLPTALYFYQIIANGNVIYREKLIIKSL